MQNDCRSQDEGVCCWLINKALGLPGQLTKCSAQRPSCCPADPPTRHSPSPATRGLQSPGQGPAAGVWHQDCAHSPSPPTPDPSKHPHSQGPFPTDPVLPARALPASLKGNLRAQHLYGTLGVGTNEPDVAGASCAHKHSDPSSGQG